MTRRDYQIVVIGGGHAGVEAAWAAANLLPVGGTARENRATASVALVTLDPTKIGVMSCNPAIGGLAKGQIVREIDALGGLMGLATDATGIQFKVLNTSKGPAVWGPRAQCDKHAYAEAVQRLIASRPEIEVIAGAVEEIVVERGRIAGVIVRNSGQQEKAEKWKVESGNKSPGPGASLSTFHCPLSTFPHSGCPLFLSAPAIVLTTGTFMRGLMHTGESKTPGGRFGEAAAVGISRALRDLGFELGRLKTGTPPRLKRSTIDWDALDAQRGDDPPTPFSDLTTCGMPTALSGHVPDVGAKNEDMPTQSRGHATRGHTLHDSVTPSLHAFPVLDQVDCRITSTNRAIHDAIRANIHRAPMYSGQIESAGPRYCPSIEDKVVRFGDRDSHHVFLEPESLRDDWIYCNGISTSLPKDVQDQIVRAMPGCDKAHIYRYGYAVEYDMVRPHQIAATAMTKRIDGLFLAGQINGTSGYEEAAAQGLIAGINAARFVLGQTLITIGRDQAYIGVLMDDLVTKTPVEPYRMFTSRAEHRLLLRADNAADRLTPLAIELGLLDSTVLGLQRKSLFADRQRHLADINRLIDTIRIEGDRLADLIRRPEFTPAILATALSARTQDASGPSTQDFPSSAILTAHTNGFYAAYIQRQHAEIKRHAELERKRIPTTLDYAALPSLRTEARHALSRFRPETLGQAGRLEGITPADLTLLAVLIKRHNAAASPAASGSAAAPVN